jgi:hypothetical protein
MMTSGDKEATLMNPERASRLNALGFVWSTTDPRHIPWDQRFNELVEYKNKFGETTHLHAAFSHTPEEFSIFSHQ